jgi:hypothetical protein
VVAVVVGTHVSGGCCCCCRCCWSGGDDGVGYY